MTATSAHFGGGGTPSIPDSFKDAGSAALPFFSPKYSADVQTMGDALAEEADEDDLIYVFVRAVGISDSIGRRGHTQGCAAGTGRVITSCAEKGPLATSPIYGGSLQIFDSTGPGVEDGDTAIDVVHLDDPAWWGHAVIGQGVLGKDVTSGSGVFLPDEIRMLCPVVNGFTSLEVGGSQIHLRDRDGSLIAKFLHTTDTAGSIGDDKPDLACLSLIVFGGHLYLVGLRHEFLYIYELLWYGGANANAVVFVQLVIALNIPAECDLQRPSGTKVGWPNYENLNLLLTQEGHVLLLGGHDMWLDTWHLGLLNVNPDKDPSGPRPLLTKLGIMEGDLSGTGKNLFEEGLAVARYDEDHSKIAFVAAPWDYTYGCELFGLPSGMCTALFGWDRHF